MNNYEDQDEDNVNDDYTDGMAATDDTDDTHDDTEDTYDGDDTDDNDDNHNNDKMMANVMMLTMTIIIVVIR